MLCLLVSAAPAMAQRLSGSAMAFNVQHHVLFQDSVSQQTGIWVGGVGALRVGPVRLGVSGLVGVLDGDANAANPRKRVRSSALTLHVAPTPEVMIGVQAEARRFEADIGVISWRLLGINAWVAPHLGLAGLRGLVDASYFPAASVMGSDDTMSSALRGSIGIMWAPQDGRVLLSMAYRFERFDFETPAGGSTRLEQFRGLVGGVGLRLGR